MVMSKVNAWICVPIEQVLLQSLKELGHFMASGIAESGDKPELTRVRLWQSKPGVR